MKSALLALLLWQAAAPVPWVQTADRQYLRYQRTITPVTASGTTCAVIDAQIFPHSSPSLKDLRLYQQNPGQQDQGQQNPQQSRELPYAVTLSEPAQPDTEPARVLNLGLRGNSIVFDLQMPNRPYTDVTLDLSGQDFLATATVTGSAEAAANPSTQQESTKLGEFTLFDLTSQHLSRSTTLHLQESTFPFLHVVLTASPAPGTRGFRLTPQIVQSATVPPSREAQSLYTIAAETTQITQRGRQSIATFSLPARVPIEQISFALAPDFKSNFSRDVRITDNPEGTAQSASETIAGTILRVHLTQSGREIRQQQLSIPATLGSNLQTGATVEVAVDNGDDPPLPITAVRLQMRQRKLCFDAPTTQPLTLFYGDPALTAPQYDYARLFNPTGAINSAQLGPEQQNPIYRPRPDNRPMTERHPETLWIVLLVVVCILALVAIRSSKTVHHHH